MASKVRLFVDHPLGEAQTVPLERDQAHYLFNVMRLTEGAVLSLFNGSDGEWDACVTKAGKRNGLLTCLTQTRPLTFSPDIWLLVAPIRKARMDYVIEKSVELGVGRILPVQTAFTNERMRHDKLQAHAIEAAEQCGAVTVPPIDPLSKLDRVLDDWPQDRSLIFCDETLIGQPSEIMRGLPAPSAILIGPEGGFSPQERARLHEMPAAHPVSLGPRILRADTAAVAALTLWQSRAGDW